MRRYLIFICFCFFSNLLSGQEKTFIREYFSKASETDSKVSSRQKALTEVKALLIEELGTYVESYVNYEVSEDEKKITKEFFTNEIKTLSAGITETTIIEENWDGYEYYVKAKIIADPEEVLKRINQTLSVRRSNKIIDSLNIILNNSNANLELKNKELNQIKDQLIIQNSKVIKKQNSLDSLNKQLAQAQKQLAIYQAQESQILSEIEAIEEKMRKSATKAIENVRIGMTHNEVKRVCGNPRSIDGVYEDTDYNYGSVWILFKADIVIGAVKAEKYVGDLGMDYYRRENADIKIK